MAYSNTHANFDVSIFKNSCNLCVHTDKGNKKSGKYTWVKIKMIFSHT